MFYLKHTKNKEISVLADNNHSIKLEKKKLWTSRGRSSTASQRERENLR